MISFADKRKIYQLLCDNFDMDTKYPFEKIALFLTNKGHRKEKYGYIKMRTMLEDMPEFLEINTIIIVNNEHQEIIIHEWKERENIESNPIPLSDLPEQLEDNVLLVRKTLSIMNQCITGLNEYPSEAVLNSLYSGYRKARQENKISYNDRGAYEFLIDDISIVASIKPSNGGSYKWVLNYVSVAPPVKALENFAYLGEWSDFIKNLKEKCLDENWSFPGDEVNKDIVLKNYIQYTFYRLKKENKICINKEKNFACFNTGLLSKSYDDIFACFESNKGKGKSDWLFVEFCTTSESSYYGNLISGSFNSLPEPASYFVKREDLLFDLSKDIIIKYDHIILDNLSRFPLNYLKSQYHDCADILSYLKNIELDANEQKRKEYYEELGKIIKRDNDLSKRIRNDVDGAIALAKKQVRFNYKTAVPIYYPANNTMSLMLPISLTHSQKTDFALVVNLQENGKYRAQTILTLEQAYIDARLVCRPNSEWLVNA